jgi:hypothetical protein
MPLGCSFPCRKASHLDAGWVKWGIGTFGAGKFDGRMWGQNIVGVRSLGQITH